MAFYAKQNLYGGWGIYRKGKRLAVAGDISNRRMAMFIAGALTKGWKDDPKEEKENG